MCIFVQKREALDNLKKNKIPPLWCYRYILFVSFNGILKYIQRIPNIATAFCPGCLEISCHHWVRMSYKGQLLSPISEALQTQPWTKTSYARQWIFSYNLQCNFSTVRSYLKYILGVKSRVWFLHSILYPRDPWTHLVYKTNYNNNSTLTIGFFASQRTKYIIMYRIRLISSVSFMLTINEEFWLSEELM